MSCWLLFGVSTAEAGFIAASVDRDAAWLAATSSMAPSGENDDSPSSVNELTRWLQQHAAWAGPSSPTSGGAAGAPATSSSSGGAPSACLPPVAAAPLARLVVRLAVARDEWLPPPFLSGIFRPPRSTY
jgi:hypothetical protein